MGRAEGWLAKVESAIIDDDLAGAIELIRDNAVDGSTGRREAILLQGRVAALKREERMGIRDPAAMMAAHARLMAAVFDLATDLTRRSSETAAGEGDARGRTEPADPPDGAAGRTTTFVSHAWSDEAVTRAAVRQLSAAGIDVWVDFEELEPGDRLVRRVGQALRDQSNLLALLSPTYLGRAWTRTELEIALSMEIAHRRDFVVAVVVPPATRSDAIAAIPLLTDRLVPDVLPGDRPLPDAVVQRLGRPIVS